MHRFVYLKLGLAVVLVWVGVKMLLLEVYKIPTVVSLGVVAAILTVTVVASLLATRGQRRPDLPPQAEPLPSSPEPAGTSGGS
jgi:tellurite resistance protein TerC